MDVLQIIWKNTLFNLEKKAIIAKDENMKLYVHAFIAIKDEVRDYLLSEYVKQCRKKHIIAFMEWRLHFSKIRQGMLNE